MPIYTVNKLRSYRGTEGWGFNADLMKDGHKIAFVIDSAEGGMYSFEWVDRKHEKEMQEYVKTLPEVDTPIYGKLKYDIDLFVAKLVDDFETEKKLKKACRKGTLYRLKEDPPDRWRALGNKFDENVKAYLIEKYGNSIDEIVNERIKQ